MIFSHLSIYYLFYIKVCKVSLIFAIIIRLALLVSALQLRINENKKHKTTLDQL